MPMQDDSLIEIFFDMDGVISDFDRHCDMTGIRRADGRLDYSSMNTVEWYANMPVFDGARQFYDALCLRSRVRFLTAPIKFPECFAGKAEWIKKFVPHRQNEILADLMIVASKDKQLVARPGRVLIDDRRANIDGWIAAGGIGILHQGNYTESLQCLDEAIAGMTAANDKSAEQDQRFLKL